MRGEYKVPGSKLAVADIKQRKRGSHRHCQISGDFLVEEALGAPFLRRWSVLPERLPCRRSQQRSLRTQKGAQLFGFTPKPWPSPCARVSPRPQRDFGWNIIDAKAVTPPAYGASDEDSGGRVASGRQAPTLRFWT